ncbi:hypothetical protein BMW23_0776 [Bodo saltans virus]|uniref:Uncharacterized protein n=1 Tax=Bodo saltans virus TaxID=2024608 RepID=A0A2H4UV75_9VIRU|nr:hypothetical protein QJ851_gp0759 [Bodo saltans virus]ATZ80822.1 hypothetical protein BMW23_0776 [Bodo saltans virus]
MFSILDDAINNNKLIIMTPIVRGDINKKYSYTGFAKDKIHDNFWFKKFGNLYEKFKFKGNNIDDLEKYLNWCDEYIFSEYTSYRRNMKTNLKELFDYFKAKYENNEFPFTLQYANYYDFFNKETVNNGDIVQILVTRKRDIKKLRKIYPHYIIAQQPEMKKETVGLTRFSLLSLAFTLNIKKFSCIDDNICDFSLNGNNGERILFMNNDSRKNFRSANPTLNYELLFNFLQNYDMNNIGYIGLTNISKYMMEKIIEYDKKNICEKTNQKIGDYYVSMIEWNTKECPNYNVESSTKNNDININQHTPKAIFINSRLLQQHDINYDILQTIGEDIYFTKYIVEKGISINRFNISQIKLLNERRPNTVSLQDNNMIMLDDTISSKCSLKGLILLITHCTIPIHNGSILFYSNKCLKGDAGVYGPIRLIDKNEFEELNKNSDCDMRNYVSYDEKNDVYFIKPGFDIYDKKYKNFVNNKSASIYTINKFSQIDDYNLRSFNKETDSFFEPKGHVKYQKEYEYIQCIQAAIFKIFIKKIMNDEKKKAKLIFNTKCNDISDDINNYYETMFKNDFIYDMMMYFFEYIKINLLSQIIKCNLNWQNNELLYVLRVVFSSKKTRQLYKLLKTKLQNDKIMELCENIMNSIIEKI